MNSVQDARLGRFGGSEIEPHLNVLRRKLRSEASGSDEQAISPVKAARMGLARAGEKAFNLALRIGSIRQSRLELAEVAEQLHDDWALFPLLHDDGSVGVMCFEPNCIMAFVERQTLGHVKAEAGDTRRLTTTDKALATPFIEQFLRQFDTTLADAPTAYWTCGYHSEDAVASRHLMVLQLDASEYRGFDVQSEVVGTGRMIAMRLLLPIKEKADPRAIKSKSKNAKTKEALNKEGKTLKNAALAANVEMDAIMCRLVLPLSELGQLKPGQLIPLPRNATKQAYLVDRVGRTEQPIHLGQLHGLRAVRLIQNEIQESQDNDLLPVAIDAAPNIAAPIVSDQQIAPEQTDYDELDDMLKASKSG